MAPVPNDQNKIWRHGTSIQQYLPRSYVVNVDGHLYRRNRKFIRFTTETIPESILSDQSVVNYQSYSDKLVDKLVYKANQSVGEASVIEKPATSDKVKMSGKNVEGKDNTNVQTRYNS